MVHYTWIIRKSQGCYNIIIFLQWSTQKCNHLFHCPAIFKFWYVRELLNTSSLLENNNKEQSISFWYVRQGHKIAWPKLQYWEIYANRFLKMKHTRTWSTWSRRSGWTRRVKVRRETYKVIAPTAGMSTCASMTYHWIIPNQLSANDSLLHIKQIKNRETCYTGRES